MEKCLLFNASLTNRKRMSLEADPAGVKTTVVYSLLILQSIRGTAVATPSPQTRGRPLSKSAARRYLIPLSSIMRPEAFNAFNRITIGQFPLTFHY